MPLEFCERWAFPFRKAIGEMEESEARRRHKAKESYAALIFPDDMASALPKAVVSVEDKFVSVAFLDELGRKDLHYSFQRIKASKIFLDQATYFEFDAVSDDVITSRTFVFRDDGSITLLLFDRRRNERRESEIEGDVSGNWDTFPAFGKYGHLLRKER